MSYADARELWVQANRSALAHSSFLRMVVAAHGTAQQADIDLLRELNDEAHRRFCELMKQFERSDSRSVRRQGVLPASGQYALF